MSGERYYIYRGKSITIQDMVEMSGVCDGTIRTRLSKGWTVEAAMQPPLRKYSRNVLYEWDGRMCTIAQIAEETKIPVDRIRRRHGRFPDMPIKDVVERARQSMYATQYTLDGSPVRLVEVCRRYGIRYNATRVYLANHDTTLDAILRDPAIVAMLKRIESTEDGRYFYKAKYRTVEEIAEMESLDPERLWDHMDASSVSEAVRKTREDSANGRAFLAGFELRETAHTICANVLYGPPSTNGFREEDGAYTFGEGIAKYYVRHENALAHLTMEYRRTGKKGGLSRWYGKLNGMLREVNKDGTC